MVDRELRVASRRRRTYWERVASAAFAMVVASFMLLALRGMSPGIAGRTLFVALSVLVFLSCAAAGRFASDCMAEEKREGTLGLLFLTRLKGHDIVMGKLAATSVGALYATLAVFPVMALALLLGGVDYGELLRAALVALNLLFLGLASGVFASTIHWDERKAASSALLMMALVTLGPLLVAGWLMWKHDLSAIPPAAYVFSPVAACFQAFDPLYRTAPWQFWTAMAVTHVYGWCFFIGASLLAPRTWQDGPAGRRRITWRDRCRKWFQGPEEVRSERRRRMLEVNPFFWLTARYREKHVLVWLVLGGFVLVWVAVAVFVVRESRSAAVWFNPTVYVCTALLLHTILKVWIASEAARQLHLDRRSGALELLLSTPLRVRHVTRGQRLAIIRQFGGPVLAVLAVDAVLVALGLGSSWLGDAEERRNWVLFWLAGVGIFLLDLPALVWAGMWFGLKGRRLNRATSSATSIVLGAPWGVFFLTLIAVGVIDYMFPGLFRNLGGLNPMWWVLYWFVLSVLVDVFVILGACGRLHSDLRYLAAERFPMPYA